MKQAFYKIVSFFMIFVVLFSTMSFTVDLHYCGDTLIDTSIFHKVETCAMEMQKSLTEGCSITKKDCCNDEQVSIDGQNELQLSFDTLTFDQQLFVATFFYSYINLFEGLEEHVTSYRDYIPPLVISQIYKRNETYLI